MKRKITWVGLVVTVVAVIAAAAAYAVSGGELPGNRTSGHVAIQGVVGGDREHLDCRRVVVVGRHPVGLDWRWRRGRGWRGHSAGTEDHEDDRQGIAGCSREGARKARYPAGGAHGRSARRLERAVHAVHAGRRHHHSVQQAGKRRHPDGRGHVHSTTGSRLTYTTRHRRGRSGAIRKRVAAPLQAARAEPLRGPLHSARAGSTRGLRGEGPGNGRAHLRGRAPGVAQVPREAFRTDVATEVDPLAERMVAFLGGARDSFADVELDLDWCTGCQRSASRRCARSRTEKTVTYSEVAALAGHLNAQRAVGSVCAQNRFGWSSRATALSPRTVWLVRIARTRVQASAAGVSKVSLSPGPPERLAGIVPRKECDRLAELSGLAHTAGSLHLRGRGEIALHLDLASPAAPGAPSVSCGELGLTSEIRTYQRHAFGRENANQLHVAGDDRALGVLRDAGRQPRSRAGRAATAAGGGSRVLPRGAARGAARERHALGPRAPHLEVRSATRRAPSSCASVGERLGVRLNCSSAAGTRSPSQRAGADRGRARGGGCERRRARLREQSAMGATKARANRWRTHHANLVRTSRAAQTRSGRSSAWSGEGRWRAAAKLREIAKLPAPPSVAVPAGAGRQMQSPCDEICGATAPRETCPVGRVVGRHECAILDLRRVCARPTTDSDPSVVKSAAGAKGGGGRPRNFPSGPPH